MLEQTRKPTKMRLLWFPRASKVARTHGQLLLEHAQDVRVQVVGLSMGLWGENKSRSRQVWRRNKLKIRGQQTQRGAFPHPS